MFATVVNKVGINPCVEVPEEISRAFRRRGHVPVRGQLNGRPIKATLVPVGGGRHRLYINGQMRKAAGVGVGDTVTLSLAFDPQPRDPPVPPALAAALEASPAAKAVFDKFPPSHKREILDYLNWLKRPDSLERHIKKLIGELAAEERDKDGAI